MRDASVVPTLIDALAKYDCFKEDPRTKAALGVLEEAAKSIPEPPKGTPPAVSQALQALNALGSMEDFKGSPELRDLVGKLETHKSQKPLSVRIAVCERDIRHKQQVVSKAKSAVSQAEQGVQQAQEVLGKARAFLVEREGELASLQGQHEQTLSTAATTPFGAIPDSVRNEAQFKERIAAAEALYLELANSGMLSQRTLEPVPVLGNVELAPGFQPLVPSHQQPPSQQSPPSADIAMDGGGNIGDLGDIAGMCAGVCATNGATDATNGVDDATRVYGPASANSANSAPSDGPYAPAATTPAAAAAKGKGIGGKAPTSG